MNEQEQRQEMCPLCGLPSFMGFPHKECTDYEQYMADQQEVKKLCDVYDRKEAHND